MGLTPGSAGPAGDRLGLWSPSPGNRFLHLRSNVAQRGRNQVKSFMRPGEPALGPGASPSPHRPWFTIHRKNKPKPAASFLHLRPTSSLWIFPSPLRGWQLGRSLGTNPSVHTLPLPCSPLSSKLLLLFSLDACCSLKSTSVFSTSVQSASSHPSARSLSEHLQLHLLHVLLAHCTLLRPCHDRHCDLLITTARSPTRPNAP